MNNFASILYNESYKKVDPNLMPIVIPSYNRPNCKLLSLLRENMNDEFKYPIYVVVRDSQYDMYRSNVEEDINIIREDDSVISNTGLVRRYIVNKFYELGYENIFMIDDDISIISYIQTRVNSMGNTVSDIVKDSNVFKSLAIMQEEHEKLCSIYDNYLMTGLMPKFRCFNEKYSNSENSLVLLQGSVIQLLAINIKRLVENNIMYNDSSTHGHEDSELIIQIMKNKFIYGCVTGITYLSGEMNSKMDFNSVEERFKVYWDRVFAQHPDILDAVSYKDDDVDKLHPTIRWMKVRKKYYNEYYRDNKFDIYKILRG